MLYLKEEETEAKGDTVPPQRVPEQHDLTHLLSCSVKWALAFSLSKKLKRRG